MTKRIALLLAVLSFWAASFGGAVACGGSSSETPPPLEPDPRGNNYLGGYGKASLEADADGGVAPAPRKRTRESEQAAPRSSAPSTWGSGRSPLPR